jgi:hypothetical protein
MAGESRVDRLLADSEKLREDLLRMAARLMTFSENLTAETQALRIEAGGSDGTGEGAHRRPPRATD